MTYSWYRSILDLSVWSNVAITFMQKSKIKSIYSKSLELTFQNKITGIGIAKNNFLMQTFFTLKMNSQINGSTAAGWNELDEYI